MKKALAFLLLAFLVLGTVSAQEISERQEISIFALSYEKAAVPAYALNTIDADIQSIFVKLGRFTVLGSQYRLESENVNAFIQAIQDSKAANTEIPEEVAFGHEIFTEADLNALTSSFMVVVPSILNFSLEESEPEEKGDEITYTAKITTNFSFIDVENGTTFDMFQIETSGYSNEEEEQAVQRAVDSIPGSLENKIRFMPVFQLKTGVLEVDGEDVYMELGANLGIQIGDEYVMQTATVNAIGRETIEEDGLLVVKEVQSDFSIARILYGKPAIGDQIVEVPRSGIDIDLYATGGLGLIGARTLYPALGFRSFVSRGSLDLRGFLGGEVILINDTPFYIYLGAEYNLTFRRLQLSPYAAIGYGGVLYNVSSDPRFVSAHVTGMAGANINYLFSRDMKFYAQGEVVYYQDLGLNSLSASFFTSHVDLRLSAGVRFKL